jgi:hypothetical protein
VSHGSGREKKRIFVRNRGVFLAAGSIAFAIQPGPKRLFKPFAGSSAAHERLAYDRVVAVLGSRSGRGFLVHLSVCAALTVGVSCGYHYLSLNWFIQHKGSEKVTALQLVDAFVTNYSAIRSQFGESAPVRVL